MLFIGPHVSISGSISLAVERAFALKATGFALFTKNQRQWNCPALEDKDIYLFKENIKKYGYSFKSILPHAGYLINLATPDDALMKKSLDLFLIEAERVTRLGIDRINIHPGAYKEGDRIDGIKRCARMVDIVLDRFPSLSVAIENTAGAGTIIGNTFEDLEQILEKARNKDRIGFTLDTAHLYGAGFDVRNDINGILDRFLSIFGRDKLYGMHLNDSKVPLSSNKDRHDNLGLGLIGKEAFLEIVRRDEVQDIPLILETPNEELWSDEIRELLDASKG